MYVHQMYESDPMAYATKEFDKIMKNKKNEQNWKWKRLETVSVSTLKHMCADIGIGDYWLLLCDS